MNIKNLVPIPNTKSYYVNSEGVIYRISEVYVDNSNGSNRYVLYEGKVRHRFSHKWAMKIYNEYTKGFTNSYNFRDELIKIIKNPKDVTYFIHKSKKFRSNELWEIKLEITNNKLRLFVNTNLKFKEFYSKLKEGMEIWY